MAGYVAISGQLTGTPVGTVPIGPFTIAGNTSNDYQTYAYTFFSGNTQIAIPVWATGVIIQPNTANAVQLTLKGTSAADTGMPIALTTPTLITFNTSDIPSQFYLNAASNMATVTQITFF